MIATGPDRLLRELDLDRAALLEMEALSDSGRPVVYLSGSLVEGFGNQNSDIDVFVIGDRKSTNELVITKEACTISIHLHGRRRIDFEYWSEERMREILGKLDHVDLGHDFVAEKLAPIEELFVHRLRIGLPVAGASQFELYQNEFDFDTFCGYLTQQAIHRIDGALEDVIGMLDDDDFDVAILRARELANLTADAWGHAFGNTNPLPKWRAKVLQALPDGPRHRRVRDSFWRLQFPPGLLWTDRGAMRAYATACVDFSHEVVAWIQP